MTCFVKYTDQRNNTGMLFDMNMLRARMLRVRTNSTTSYWKNKTVWTELPHLIKYLYDTYFFFSKYWGIIFHQTYMNFAFKVAYSKNQQSRIIKGRVSGFVDKTGNNGINLNEPLCEQFSFYEVEILYRQTARSWDIPVCKNLCEKGDVRKLYGRKKKIDYLYIFHNLIYSSTFWLKWAGKDAFRVFKVWERKLSLIIVKFKVIF